METLHSELSTLCQAVQYQNFSSAAEHIGISQPQLSRIVAKLEKNMGVVLFNRGARRRSGWTPVAQKIVDTYLRHTRKLGAALQRVQTDEQSTQVNIGCLDGLLGIASKFVAELFENSRIQLIDLDVFDLSELEERFERDELDLVFTCREPGRTRSKHIRLIGTQTFETCGSDPKIRVMSPFEYTHQIGKKPLQKATRVMLSNSMAVRRHWVETYGGIGEFPSDVRHKSLDSEGEVPVYLIASDLISPTLWERTARFKF